MTDKNEDVKIFTLTTKDGQKRDVYESCLNDKSKVLATDLQNAFALKQKKKEEYDNALLVLQTNALIDAYISKLADEIEVLLPQKIVTKKGDK